MSKLVPIVAGVTGTTIIGVGGGYLLSTQNTKSFKIEFKHAILDFTKDTALITEKLTKLKSSNSVPKHSKLISAKNKEVKGTNQGLNDFKEGCKEIYNSAFDKKDSDLFRDFQSYCSKNIKDVITTENWFASGADWSARFNKLKVENTKPSSVSLTTIANGAGNDGNKLKEWCENIANSIYEGEDNLEFKDAKASCGKDN
ncbi:hypothetical protein A6V39_03280 [Candidatus Mycoplasma haematobovis]|uniref:Uncharacterized protein n=1 Tax=Candidatus Mycoplasma haematobovis TaxID=432608 RepID=A0A1A9QBR2_9MOLU|nr:hypothetical protein [Candidatus Mycoplasma haematobovis]OAL09907.1 hypothetical protein A6V39_03280 [Candidatus Mycoplasma haematobovis]